MIRTIINRNFHVYHGKSGDHPALHSLVNALLDSRNVGSGNNAADDFILKLEPAAFGERLDLQPAIPILASAAGLFLILSLYFGFAPDGLPVWNLGRFDVHLDAKAALQSFQDDIQMHRAHAGNDQFVSLRIAFHLDRRVLFAQPVKRMADFFFIGAGFGHHTSRQHRVGERDRSKPDGCLRIRA